MGSGKTTIGQQLATHYKIPFIDCDRTIESQENESITTIFKTKGECYFREQETELLSNLSMAQTSIIATGGGIITNTQNQQLIKQLGGDVIYLHAELPELMKRIENETKTRPLLNNTHESTIKTLFNKRLPLYRRTATLEINTSTLSIETVIQTIITELKQ